MTTIFIISGFRLDKTAKEVPEFKLFKKLLEIKGYRVVLVDISYRYKVHTRFVEEFLARYSSQKTDKNVVIGNSFGAVTALLSAELFRPDNLILCSISPFFKETLQDDQYYNYASDRFGIRRANDLKKYSIKEVAKKISKSNIDVQFLYGEKEKQGYKELVDFTIEIAPLFSKNKVLEVKGAPHGLKSNVYYEFVANLL